MSLHHSFDIQLAQKYGVNEAILIHHFQHWISFNRKLKRNFKDGRTWTYQTLSEIAAHFPYLSKSEIFELIERLCTGKGRRSKQGQEFEPVLRKGNFNKSKFDKTTWYSFENEEMFTTLAEAKMVNGSSHIPIPSEPTPIPHTIPHTKTDLPPLPPPLCPKEPISKDPPSKEEEEEIARKLKERPSNAPRIGSMKKWREIVLNDIRVESRAKEQALEADKQRLKEQEAKQAKEKETAANEERLMEQRVIANRRSVGEIPRQTWMEIKDKYIILKYKDKSRGQFVLRFDDPDFQAHLRNFRLEERIL